jgi:predicted Zn finger-like uncharacterized protein
MDVTCSRCQSVYEFEDTLVSPKGVVVRCTHCGHLFKIFPSGTAPALPEESGWMLRREDGTVFAIDKFTTLQKWIGQGKVTRRDELSRTGESWKRLGDIVELSPFFDLVERSGTSQRTETSPSIPAPPGTPEPAAPAAAEPPAARPKKVEIVPEYVSLAAEERLPPPKIPTEEPSIGSGATLAAAPAVSPSEPPPSPAVEEPTVQAADERPTAPSLDHRPTTPAPPRAAPSQPPPAERASLRPAASRPPRREVMPPGNLRFSTAEVELPRPRRTGLYVGLSLLVLVVVGAVLAVIYREQVVRIYHRLFGGGEPAATATEQHLLKADELLARETGEAMRLAEAEYRAVLKFDAQDDRALGGLLELRTTAAQFLRDELDVGRLLGLPERDPGGASRLQAEFDGEMDRARELALALTHSGRPTAELSVAAVRALADEARLRGDREAARRLLADALARAPEDPRTRLVEALVAYDEGLSGTDLAASIGPLKQVFSRVLLADVDGSGLPRARLHLALYLALAGRGAEARAEIRCVIEGGTACPGGRGFAHGDHVVAGKIEAWLPLLPAELRGPLALALPASAGDLPPPPPPLDAGPPADVATAETDAPEAADGGAGLTDVATETGEAMVEADAGPADAPGDTTGDVPAVDATARDAAAEMPTSIDGLLDAARNALENGATSRAIQLLQRAAQLDPGDPEIHANLGYAYLDAGRTAEARRAFERANQVGGSHPDALLGLGDILLSQGSAQAALDHYRRALAVARTPYQRRIAERKIQDTENRLGVPRPAPGDAGTAPAPAPDATPPTTTPPGTRPVPISDMPAVDSEPPGLPPVTEP